MIRLRRGFTLIELLVVISIIAILSAFVLMGIGSSRDEADKLKIQSLVDDIALACDAYHSATGRYPDSEVKNMSPSLPLVAPPTKVYYTQLQSGHAGSNGPISYLEVDDEYLNPSEPGVVFDMWGQEIRYRRCPRNTQDYKGFWGSGGRQEVLSFPGNPKRFNIWSVGPDELGGNQLYQGTGTYESGGYNGDEDSQDNPRNW